MDATAILERLEGLGVTLTLDGDEVVARPGNKVPRDLIPTMKACKPGIVELLTHPKEQQPEGTFIDVGLCSCGQWEGLCHTGLICPNCYTPSLCPECGGCRRCWLEKFCRSLVGRPTG